MNFRVIFSIVLLLTLLVGAGVSSAQTSFVCGSAPAPRLVAGSQGRVTPGLPNVIRSQPFRGSGSANLGQIPAGGVFTALAGYGPQCGDGMYWYLVTYNGITGWTPEGSADGAYWTEPLGATGCTTVSPRLSIGGQGRVTPGLPNVIRSQPSRASGSLIIGLIPAGGVFNVLNGPSCSDSINWWLASYNGVTGWTGEGQGSTYWVEPASGTPPGPSLCPGVPAPHLIVGASAYVPAGLGVTLYQQAMTTSSPIINMAGGSWFQVLQGPTCSEGVNWYQVNYNTITGWLRETQGSGYAVEPFVCNGFQPTRLVPGRSGRVLPGLPNNLRAEPSLSARLIGQIPGGQTVVIISGPQCGNNGAWWQVYSSGVYGWTMEGQGSSYWLEPTS